MPENINDIMLLELQADAEHSRLLNLIRIKNYALRKYCDQFKQTNLFDYFNKEAQNVTLIICNSRIKEADMYCQLNCLCLLSAWPIHKNDWGLKTYINISSAYNVGSL
jgi:hypothetical protein